MALTLFLEDRAEVVDRLVSFPFEEALGENYYLGMASPPFYRNGAPKLWQGDRPWAATTYDQPSPTPDVVLPRAQERPWFEFSNRQPTGTGAAILRVVWTHGATATSPPYEEIDADAECAAAAVDLGVPVHTLRFQISDPNPAFRNQVRLINYWRLRPVFLNSGSPTKTRIL